MFKKYKETGVFDKNEIYPYITEGIGEDFLPQNVDFTLIDHFEKVTDRDAAIMTGRIAREEGIFAGNSAGSAMAGLLQLADRFKAGRDRRRDLPRPRHALPRQDVQPRLDAREGLPRSQGPDRARPGRQSREGAARHHRSQRDRSTQAAHLMTEHAYSQIPVTRRRPPRRHRSTKATCIRRDREEPGRVARAGRGDHAAGASRSPTSRPSVDALAAMLTPESPAVLVRDFKSDETYIITRWDIIKALS